MRRVSAKFVLELLMMEHKQLRLEVLQDMLDYANSDPEFLNIVTTGDESWVYGYDPETKMQLSQWKHLTSPRPKKARQVWSNVKVMLTVFFVPVGLCITSAHHKAKTLTKNTTWKSFVAFVILRCKRPDLWASGMWNLHDDNTPAHSSQLIQTFLAKHNISVVQQAPCSPDMAPCDFGCSPTWKRSWKGLYFSHTTTLFGTRRPSCIPFTKRHSRNALNDGWTAGRSVFSHKETTSNGIRVADLQACKCIFRGWRSDTFWTGHVTSGRRGSGCLSYQSLLVSFSELCKIISVET